MTRSELYAKYDVPTPRYTSYPTVPQWSATPTLAEWTRSIQGASTLPDASLAVYVHLPFCESLCSFCGCNNAITRDHSREDPYVAAILTELSTYLSLVPEVARQPFEQLHLGGGTPTFLSAESLARLVDGIRERLPHSSPAFEGSVEVDPRVTTVDQLRTLRTRGFSRISLGVQDVDPEVQRLVNRIQPVDTTERLCEAARTLEFASINLDLIYGLPGQTPASMARLVEHVRRLSPDRLAVYSFARVPWIRPAQRRFTDEQIPTGAEKRALYEAVREPLIESGYLEIGMDHFARADDSLARVSADGRLHRNFMGYTEVRTTTLLGLGVSAISETPECYHQNEKIVTTYQQRAAAGEIPTLRGHQLSEDDRRRRARIWELMTRFSTELDERVGLQTELLQSLVADGLVEIHGGVLRVPLAGRAFLRNTATLFDAYLVSMPPQKPTYSSSV